MDAIYDRAADAVRVLEGGPQTTTRLLDALGFDHTLDAVAGLHRHGRNRGYGQCEDGLWRLADDSDELRSLLGVSRATPSHEAFCALRNSSIEAWDIDAPLQALRSITAA